MYFAKDLPLISLSLDQLPFLGAWESRKAISPTVEARMTSESSFTRSSAAMILELRQRKSIFSKWDFLNIPKHFFLKPLGKFVQRWSRTSKDHSFVALRCFEQGSKIFSAFHNLHLFWPLSAFSPSNTKGNSKKQSKETQRHTKAQKLPSLTLEHIVHRSHHRSPPRFRWPDGDSGVSPKSSENTCCEEAAKASCLQQRLQELKIVFHLVFRFFRYFTYFYFNNLVEKYIEVLHKTHIKYVVGLFQGKKNGHRHL